MTDIKTLLERCGLFIKSVRAVDKSNGRETSQANQLLSDLDSAISQLRVVEVTLSTFESDYGVACGKVFILLSGKGAYAVSPTLTAQDATEVVASLDGAVLRVKEET